MKIYEKPSLRIESLLADKAVAVTYADPNDYPETANGPEVELSDDFFGDLLNQNIS